MIVDDHPLLVEGLRNALQAEPTFNVVASATTLAEARDLAQCNTLHLVIIDLFLTNNENGINLAIEFGTRYPDLPLLMYTANNDLRNVIEARNAGVRGYVLKGTKLDKIILAIEVILAGGFYLDRNLPPPLPDPIPPPKLTPSEEKVLRRFARWMTTKEVSEDLGLRLPGVRAHRNNIMWKLGLYNTPQLYREAIKRYGNPDDPNYIAITDN